MSTSTTSTSNLIYATGRRKRAIARVWLAEGAKEHSVNGKSLEQFFPRQTLRMIIRQPLEATQTVDRFGIQAQGQGGGLSGRA